MKCKRRSYYMPLYSKAMLERSKRRRNQRIHQRYTAGGHVDLMFRPYPKRYELSYRVWCKTAEGSIW